MKNPSFLFLTVAIAFLHSCLAGRGGYYVNYEESDERPYRDERPYGDVRPYGFVDAYDYRGYADYKDDDWTLQDSDSHDDKNFRPNIDKEHRKDKKTLEWGYKRCNGPFTWPKQFPAGNGKEQSPIDIITKSKSVGHDRTLGPLKFNYKPSSEYDVKNNGRGFVVEFDDKFESSVAGGPLPEPYYLKQIIVHWGRRNDRGSEHSVNGRYYSAELQLVHFNRNKYNNYEEASKHGDGLAIVAIFLKICDNPNKAVAVLIKQFASIQAPGSVIKSKQELPIADLLPPCFTKYWTYPGSLTQPPLTQNVIWIVIQRQLDISKYQIGAFRKLFPSNFRPAQPLNCRTVRASFCDTAKHH